MKFEQGRKEGKTEGDWKLRVKLKGRWGGKKGKC